MSTPRLPHRPGSVHLLQRTLSTAGCGLALLTANAVLGDVVINEVLTSNVLLIENDRGDYSDWLELYNRGSSAADLEGYFLTDDPGDPEKWALPSVSIDPNSHLLIWASGDDRRNPNQPLHTNFSLSVSGDALLLVSPQGVVLDHVGIPELMGDISYGRTSDGSEEWGYFDEPTPGTANQNSTAYSEILDPVITSHESGLYADALELQVFNPNPFAIVRYTLDGSIPTADSPLFPGVLTIDSRVGDPNVISMIPTNNGFPGNAAADAIMRWRPPEGEVAKATVVRLRPFREDALPGRPTTRTFWVGEDFDDRYRLGIFSINTDPDGLFDHERGLYVAGANFNPDASSPDRTGNYFGRGREWERHAHIEFFEPGFQHGFSSDVGIRIHGGITRRFPPKSLRVYMRGGYEASELNYPLLPGNPTTEFRRFILRNHGNDSGFEPYQYRDDGALLRDPLFQRLIKPLDQDQQDWRPTVVFINGEYWGLKNIRQRVDRHYLAIRHGVDADSIDLLVGNGSVDHGSNTDFVAVSRYARDNDLADPDHFQHVADRVDLPHLADYFLSQIYSGNLDWPHNNIRMWRSNNPPGKWRWIVFDVEWETFGHIHPNSYLRDDVEHALGAVNRSSLIISNALENEEYRHFFLNRAADHLNSIFHPSTVSATIDEMAGMIRPHVAEHIARWGRPSSFEQWEANLETLHTFAAHRPVNLRAHLVDYFDLAGVYALTLDNRNPAGGYLRVNSLIPQFDGPMWEGQYFAGIPIEVEAIPYPGFNFDGWQGAVTTQNPLIHQAFDSDPFLSAGFSPDPDFVYEGDGPAPHELAVAPYLFESWPASSPEGSYPPSMSFLTAEGPDPRLDASFDEPWSFPYNLDNRTRVVGLDERGLALINTANPQEGSEGYLGAVVLALDTRGVQDAVVDFTADLEVDNPREYALRLRYRIGDEGSFTDVLDADGQPVEYRAGAFDGQAHHFDFVPLPAELFGKAYVQLVWQYYYTGIGLSGPRDMIRLDDIRVGSPLADTWMIF